VEKIKELILVKTTKLNIVIGEAGGLAGFLVD